MDFGLVMMMSGVLRNGDRLGTCALRTGSARGGGGRCGVGGGGGGGGGGSKNGESLIWRIGVHERRQLNIAVVGHHAPVAKRPTNESAQRQMASEACEEDEKNRSREGSSSCESDDVTAVVKVRVRMR